MNKATVYTVAFFCYEKNTIIIFGFSYIGFVCNK